MPTEDPDTVWPTPHLRLRGAKSLRALAHPLRVALLNAVSLHGPITATQAAAIVDDSPSNCSFHLRVLGSAGLIEQAPGRDQRQRPWRRIPGPVSFETDGSPDSYAAHRAVVELMSRHRLDAEARWGDLEAQAPPEWQDVAVNYATTLTLTAAEAVELGRRIAQLLEPYAERREARPMGPDEAPMSIALQFFPLVTDVADLPSAATPEGDQS